MNFYYDPYMNSFYPDENEAELQREIAQAEAEAAEQEPETAEERREHIEADKADAWHDQAVDREAWRNE